MSDQTKEIQFVERPWPWSFLQAGSAALATMPFAGLTANAQQREDSRRAEHDHSSSNQGQENKPLSTQDSMRRPSTCVTSPSSSRLVSAISSQGRL